VSAAQGSDLGRSTPGLPLFRVIARRWVAIVVTVVVFAAIAMIISKREAPAFSASARVFLTTSDTSTGNSTTVDPTQLVETHAEFAASTTALDQIAKQLGTTRDSVGRRLKTQAATNGYFFTITGSASSQAGAVKLVKTDESVYQSLLVTYGRGPQSQLTRDNARLVQLKAQLAKLNNQLNTQGDDANDTVSTNISTVNGEISDVTRQIASLQLSSLNSGTVLLAEPPREDGQTAPSTSRNVIVGGILGLLLSILAIVVLYLRRLNVLDARDAADALGAPLIANITGGRKNGRQASDLLLPSLAAVMSPTVKVVALTPSTAADLSADLVASLAASWADDQGIVLILDATPQSDVRAALERLPRATTNALPRWAREPTCLARSSGSGRGSVLYSRVAPARAARPGGLAPILADRASDVDIILLLTPSLADFPMTAASAMQADAVVVFTSPETRLKELTQVRQDWPALAERIAGTVHDERPGFRRSAEGTGPLNVAGGAGASGGVEPVGPGDETRHGVDPRLGVPGDRRRPLPAGERGVDDEATDRFYAGRPGGNA
jgi:capsular polysaccharide biosynthesis protein